MKEDKEQSWRNLGTKGFSMVELIIVIAIMAVLIAIITPSILSGLEDARRQKDLHNAKSVVDCMKFSYIDGSIRFADNSGKSAVWVYVTRNKAQFYANGESAFPSIKGVQGIESQEKFAELLHNYGITSDDLTVGVTNVKDTGTTGTDVGWNWYCIYILSDSTVGVVSGPGNPSDDYLSSWGNFKSRILNWTDRDKSAMARELSY